MLFSNRIFYLNLPFIISQSYLFVCFILYRLIFFSIFFLFFSLPINPYVVYLSKITLSVYIGSCMSNSVQWLWLSCFLRKRGLRMGFMCAQLPPSPLPSRNNKKVCQAEQAKKKKEKKKKKGGKYGRIRAQMMIPRWSFSNSFRFVFFHVVKLHPRSGRKTSQA